MLATYRVTVRQPGSKFRTTTVTVDATHAHEAADLALLTLRKRGQAYAELLSVELAS
jgi:hypothetical protein